MSTKSKLITKLKDKEYRDAFVGSQINIGLPFQIRVLREQREWNQSELAKRTGMLQPRISAIESPGGSKLNIETLRRLASAFDVGLLIRFVSFSELVDWAEKFSPDTFVVPSFGEDQFDEGSAASSKAREEQAQVLMSLHHAKAFVELLKKNLDEFERQFGEIKLIDLNKPQTTPEGQGESGGDQKFSTPSPRRKVRVR